MQVADVPDTDTDADGHADEDAGGHADVSPSVVAALRSCRLRLLGVKPTGRASAVAGTESKVEEDATTDDADDDKDAVTGC